MYMKHVYNDIRTLHLCICTLYTPRLFPWPLAADPTHPYEEQPPNPGANQEHADHWVAVEELSLSYHNPKDYIIHYLSIIW